MKVNVKLDMKFLLNEEHEKVYFGDIKPGMYFLWTSFCSSIYCCQKISEDITLNWHGNRAHFEPSDLVIPVEVKIEIGD